MARHLELDWIDPLTAHVANRTGRAVFDVDLHAVGSVSVDGTPDWSYSAEKLPDGEFIGLYSIRKENGWATSPPFLEMSWRNAESSEENFKRVPLHHLEP
ncbi:hypothetical protein [Paeniglutamicibacter psychrophenolicus]|uniref:hypothetical protein n=1 Tax=Paeniglutamicibacter psychrophenolicus TaxID=257454 RepID=UPI002784FC96|nr:hypothetical protein [Paeniglutamicibacter psychrophenolicus]MDQ0096127.1 hypothetical protein [Paeniglutamicibacter psychrophenolicus]